MTEQQLVYSIINTINGGEHNNDNPTSERFIRNLLNIYRVDSINKMYKKGNKVSDEIFQTIELSFSKINFFEHYFLLPRIIEFENKAGLFLSKNEIEIPILNNSQYTSSKLNRFSKTKPFAKKIANKLTLYIGAYDENKIDQSSPYYFLLNTLVTESNSSNVSASLNCVLFDPSSHNSYDWEKDQYPYPAERIKELKEQILRKEFGIIIESKKDEVQNARPDSIRYQSEDDVSQNN